MTLRQINDDKTYMIAVATETSVSLFYTKSLGGSKASASKSKVVKKECLITLGGAHEQMIQTSIIDQTNVNVVHGSIFSMRKALVKVVSEDGKVQREVIIGAKEQAGEAIAKKGTTGQY